MLILLPPSEGKAMPAKGDPVDLDSLVFAEQPSPLREQLLDSLELAKAVRGGVARALLLAKKSPADPEAAAAIAADAGFEVELTRRTLDVIV